MPKDKCRLWYVGTILVADQYGSHIPQSATGYTRRRNLLAFGEYRKNETKKKGNIQAPQCGNPPNPPTSTFSRAHRSQMKKKAAIDSKYSSKTKEIQINVVNELSDNERTRLAAHLALVWYNQRVVHE